MMSHIAVPAAGLPHQAQPSAEGSALLVRSGLAFAEFDQLVRLIYTGVREALPWALLLDHLRCLLDANYVTLILHQPRADEPLQVVYAGRTQPALAAMSCTDLVAIDPFVNLPRERAVLLEELIDDDAWLASPCYREFHAPVDIRYHMAADLGAGPVPDCRLRVTRPPRGDRFGARERTICDLLLPHLAIAVQLRASLNVAELERGLYTGMFDRLSVGVVFLDGEGRIVKVNQAAEEILAQGDGLSLANNGLVADFPGESRELRRLIEQAVSTAGARVPGVLTGMSVRRTSGRANLGVAVRAVPLTGLAEPGLRAAALVVIRDPEARVLATHEQLQRLYRLTPAEANLALHIMDGCTVEEAARRLGVSRNTVRCQIRAIFAKTGVTRQTELLRVLLGGIAPLV
ncbi:MAG: helix-turn-helix transcriptional regulator [Steroidobacteraceae bacterium]